MKKEDIDLLSYESIFLPGITVNVIFGNHEKYPYLRKLFDEFGYGFLSPEFKSIFIDGELFITGDLNMDDLKFIESHEISHFLLGHSGPRSREDEIEADLGAYILLKKNNLSTKRLTDTFYDRHGIDFNDSRLKKLKSQLKLVLIP